jgi:hypothetical protein
LVSVDVGSAVVGGTVVVGGTSVVGSTVVVVVVVGGGDDTSVVGGTNVVVATDCRWKAKERLVSYSKSEGIFKTLVSPSKGSRLIILITPCPQRQQQPSPKSSSTKRV